MNKEEAIRRLDVIELETQELREIIEAPEGRTPEEGDVWLENDGTNHIVVIGNCGLASAMFGMERLNGHLYDGSAFSSDPFDGILKEDFTYLGKFDEVYVKISDVRDALSHEGLVGDSVLNSHKGEGIYIGKAASRKTREALRKLNII
tara:strand:- start:279 stop:722 length:444 start_codon:yes stop_codon:yes gene_type:complete